MSIYNFNKEVNPTKLQNEIEESTIVTAISHIEASSSPLNTSVIFKATLSEGDELLLNDIVDLHENTPNPEDALKVTLDQPKDLQGYPIFKTASFSDASGFRFRGASFKDTVLTGTTKDIDYLITQERYINGGRLLIDNIGIEDSMTFQVVDKDNILGFGAGVVLDQFITDYYIPTSGNLEVRLDYPARVMAGLYMRLKYTSTHASGCTVKCNLYLHWKQV